jgi:hypothetical protein
MRVVAFVAKFRMLVPPDHIPDERSFENEYWGRVALPVADWRGTVNSTRSV